MTNLDEPNINKSNVGELLAAAEELGFKGTLTLEEINTINNRFSQLHNDWKAHPVTKILLLALKIERAKHLATCELNATTTMSEVAIRSRLSAANQTNKIEAYVHKSMAESFTLRPQS